MQAKNALWYFQLQLFLQWIMFLSPVPNSQGVTLVQIWEGFKVLKFSGSSNWMYMLNPTPTYCPLHPHPRPLPKPLHLSALAGQDLSHRLLVLHFVRRHPGVAPYHVHLLDKVMGVSHHGCWHLVQLTHLKPLTTNSTVNTWHGNATRQWNKTNKDSVTFIQWL